MTDDWDDWWLRWLVIEMTDDWCLMIEMIMMFLRENTAEYTAIQIRAVGRKQYCKNRDGPMDRPRPTDTITQLRVHDFRTLAA